ncbi:hypothetical protein TOPH_04681, partial [Tolypocladium ophioglossoides CBS 100239]
MTRPRLSFLLPLFLVLAVAVVVALLFRAPVPPALAPDPAHALAPLALADGAGIALVHDARDHEGEDKDPDVAAAHGPPPAALDTDLPQAVDAGAGAVEEDAAAVAALDPGPQAGEEAAQEEAL